jgi:hypothetical protein
VCTNSCAFFFAKSNTATVNTNIRVTEIQPGMVETGKLSLHVSTLYTQSPFRILQRAIQGRHGSCKESLSRTATPYVFSLNRAFVSLTAFQSRQRTLQRKSFGQHPDRRMSTWQKSTFFPSIRQAREWFIVLSSFVV